MIVALLSSASSIHTIRWANGLNSAGVTVHLISQHILVESVDSGVHVHSFPFLGAAGYFLMVPGVRKLLREIQPDLVNAHYASGYATTARLVGYRPWLLSVWGSDVYLFPYKSYLHRWWVTSNLKSADVVASTSCCMVEQIKSLAPTLDSIYVTPFGVELDVFPDNSLITCGKEQGNQLVIGTVKSMSQVYGIDILIRAFAIVVEKLEGNGAAEVLLRLVGGGKDLDELKHLAKSLGVSELITFVGQVAYAEVPVELSRMDVFVALSRSESFGVAAIEAGAAGLPVVVSDVGGLPEVVIDGETGLVVPRENPEAAAEAILKLIGDEAFRGRLGSNGRAHVAKHYSWPACVETLVGVFQKTVQISDTKELY